MIVSAPDASRTLGKLKVLRHASRSRALNAAMKSSRHCMAAATDWAFWVIGKLARLGARIHAGSRRGREAGKSRRRPPPWTPRAAPLRLSRMFRKALALGGAALLLCAGRAQADEGMWPFDEAPVARVKDALGVTLDARWLDHLRRASVRLTNGCSASIVSRGGLILTNQHCIVGCAAQISPPDRDYVADGFVASAPGEERSCPDVQAEVLVAITDVTGPIFAAGAGKTGEEYAAARQTAIAAAERDACAGDRRYRCQVISFYEGGQYKVYKYRRYADVRLVFAPELDAAWFGGDPDNFNFPRYDLDCAFLRLYEAGRPADTPEFLRWSAVPPAVGDPVFVSGSPGVTDRRMTVAQLESQRDVALPLL